MVSTPIILTLEKKTQLTHDVYELMYSSLEEIHMLPGQFLLCDTAGEPKLRRSYSVSWAEGNHISFIIKRLPKGTGGSMAICDQEIGQKMQAWGPLGKFTLQETPFPKVFIGTGTGFAPLYFQLRACLERGLSIPSFFLFGVKELKDVFYLGQLQEWSQRGFFHYEIYCSREESALPERHHLGRITEYLTPSVIQKFNNTSETEFYICGSPAMVSEVRSILDLYGISQEKVFFEQY